MSSAHKHTNLVKKIAKSLGFYFCGISQPEFLEEDAKRLEKWLRNNQHAQMKYMENHFDKRLNPKLLFEDAQSIISLLYNYYPVDVQKQTSYKISKYAYGNDYHKVIKKKLKLLMSALEKEIGKINGRFFVDTAPILERTWAKKSGLGWIGKNSMLINKQKGSFFFIAQLIVDIKLVPDQPIKDYCGDCNKCIENCPTQAINTDRTINSNKCISYQTIELKENQINNTLKNKFNDWIFGCDICQDVCPWNRFSEPHSEHEFNIISQIKNYNKSDWENLSEKTFSKVFQQSAIQRAKYAGLKRNINFTKK